MKRWAQRFVKGGLFFLVFGMVNWALGIPITAIGLVSCGLGVVLVGICMLGLDSLERLTKRRQGDES